jgi:hypothetical protein
MKRWLCFVGLLVLAGVGIALGVAPESGFNHAWLTLALVAAFAASGSGFGTRS